MKIQHFCMAKHKIVCTNGKKVLRSCRVNNRKKPIISHFWQNISENVNSKCEKNIKKYNQASRANSSRHSANTISEVFQPNISRG